MNSGQKHLQDVAATVFTVDVCIRAGDQALMFKRSADKKVFPGWLALPGGHIEEGEDPLAAAIRETHEEVGVMLTPKNIQLKFMAMHHHADRNELFIVFGFLALLDKKPDTLSNHEGNASWIRIDELLTMETVFPPVKYYFPHVLGNKPGIVYNYSVWKNSQLVRVVSEHTDRNS